MRPLPGAPKANITMRMPKYRNILRRTKYDKSADKTVVAVPATVGRSVVIGGNVQCLIGWRVRQLERIGNGATGNLAVVHIETIT